MNMDWCLGIYEFALGIWNFVFGLVGTFLLEAPEQHPAYPVVSQVNGIIAAVGLSLVVLFFCIGIMHRFSNFHEIRRAEVWLPLFLRFFIAQTLVVNGTEILSGISAVARGIIARIGISADTLGAFTLSPEIRQAIADVDTFQKISVLFFSIIGAVVIVINAIVLVVTIYGRLFKILIYWALSPIPLASFAAESTSEIGKTYLKSFAGVALSGVVILLACVIFSHSAGSPILSGLVTDVPLLKLFLFIVETSLQMLILLSTVKIADNFVKEMASL